MPYPYLTQAELQARVGGHDPLVKLTDDDQDGVADTEVIALFLTDLDYELDAYFRAGGYTVPLTADLFRGLKRAALDIANYRLRSRGARPPSDSDLILYEKAVELFRAVAARQIVLDTVSTSVLPLDFLLESDEPQFTTGPEGNMRAM